MTSGLSTSDAMKDRNVPGEPNTKCLSGGLASLRQDKCLNLFVVVFVFCFFLRGFMSTPSSVRQFFVTSPGANRLRPVLRAGMCETGQAAASGPRGSTTPGQTTRNGRPLGSQRSRPDVRSSRKTNELNSHFSFPCRLSRLATEIFTRKIIRLTLFPPDAEVDERFRRWMELSFLYGWMDEEKSAKR